MITRFFSAACLTLLFLGSSLSEGGAQPALAIQQEDSPHGELRKFRDQLIAAINAGDIEAMLRQTTPDVVITWQDGQVCRGQAEVRTFYAEMAKKSKKTFQGYKIPPTADALTSLYCSGNAGVVHGHSAGRYFLLGKEIELANRWTATVVRVDGKWLLAGYHVSMNILDNPLLNSAKRIGLLAAGLSLAVGLGLGWVLAKRSAAKTGDQFV